MSSGFILPSKPAGKKGLVLKVYSEFEMVGEELQVRAHKAWWDAPKVRAEKVHQEKLVSVTEGDELI